MEVELGGVYGDGGVYGSGGDEVLQENMNKSYREILSEICSDIDRNMAFINDYTEGLKTRDQATYIAARKEFLEVGNQYKFDLTEASTSGEQAPAGDQQRYINNLKTILEYTNQSVENIRKRQAEAPPTDDRGVNPTITMGSTKRGKKKVLPNSMMPISRGMSGYSVGDGNMGEIQQVQMVNVGPVRAWWEGLNPNIRTFVKVGAIAAAIFAGEYFYKKYKAAKGTAEEE